MAACANCGYANTPVGKRSCYRCGRPLEADSSTSIAGPQVARPSWNAAQPVNTWSQAASYQPAVAGSLVYAKSSLDQRELQMLESERRGRGKNLTTAYLLWFFLGLLFVHRFYLKRGVKAKVGANVNVQYLDGKDVAAAVDKPFWFQLYVMRDRGFIRELIQRAFAVLDENFPPADTYICHAKTADSPYWQEKVVGRLAWKMSGRSFLTARTWEAIRDRSSLLRTGSRTSVREPGRLPASHSTTPRSVPMTDTS